MSRWEAIRRVIRAIIRRFLGYRGAVLAATLIAAMVVLSPGLTDPAELSLRNIRDTVRSQPASGDVVIVEIDAQSLTEINSWPWPRSVHGQLVDRLNAADASMIAFDVDFSSASSPEEDRAFADALARSDALVLLPAFRQVAGSGRTEILDNEPIAELRENAFLAAVNIQPDSGGLVRRALLGVSTHGLPRPSLAAMLSGTQGASDTDFAIDFAIDPETIPRLSYADIVAGRVDRSAISGKTLMIGATAIEMGDRYAVPSHGVMAGVVIQTLAAETLMAGGVPAEYGSEAAMLIALVSILILISPGTLWIRGAIFSLSGFAILLLPLVLESQFQATAQIVPALAMLLTSASAALSVLALRKYRRVALQDSDSGLPNQRALMRDATVSSYPVIVVGHVQNFSETAALFSAEEMGGLFRQLAHRVGEATNSAVYRIDDSLIAWSCGKVSDEELGDHLDAISTLLRAPVTIGSQRVDAHLSLGVASGDEADTHALVAGATVAAQRATSAGHRWERYVEGDKDDGKWHLTLLGELDEAMANGDLWMAFQPKLDLASGEVIGAEALVRWQHPTRGAIPPDSFIPLAEKRGRIGDLTLFALDRTLEALVHWQGKGSTLGVSINVSAKHLDDAQFIDAFNERVEQSNIDPGLLTVEITESGAMENEETAIAAMDALRDRGIRLSVDDYGTGQSTLTYLKRLPADEIKIDKSFVQGVETNRSDQILIRSTIELAHELGLKVVAEGIEDVNCLEILTDMGCDIGQGYFIGKAMSLDALDALISGSLAEIVRQAA